MVCSMCTLGKQKRYTNGVLYVTNRNRLSKGSVSYDNVLAYSNVLVSISETPIIAIPVIG